jgi:hypothetical protein
VWVLRLKLGRRSGGCFKLRLWLLSLLLMPSGAMIRIKKGRGQGRIRQYARTFGVGEWEWEWDCC